MPDTGTLWIFVVASFVLVATPGPAVLYLVGRSTGEGRRAGFASMLGVETGELAYVVFVAVGLSTLIARSSLALGALRYLGAVYLIGLGVRAWRRSGQVADGESRASHRHAFRQGFVVQILNPKVALFFVAYFPQFLRPHHAVAPQVLLLGAIYVAIAVASDSVYVLVSSSLAARVGRNARPGRRLSRFSAVTYIALGIAAGLSGDRHSTAKALAKARLA